MNQRDQEAYVGLSAMGALARQVCAKLPSVSTSRLYGLTRSLERLNALREAQETAERRTAVLWSRAPSPAVAAACTAQTEELIRSRVPFARDAYLAERARMDQLGDSQLYPELVVGFPNLLLRAQQQLAFCSKLSHSLSELHDSFGRSRKRFQERAADRVKNLIQMQTFLTNKCLQTVVHLERVSQHMLIHAGGGASRATFLQQLVELRESLDASHGLQERLGELQRAVDALAAQPPAAAPLLDEAELAAADRKLTQQRLELEKILSAVKETESAEPSL